MNIYKKLRLWLSVAAILGIAIYLLFGPTFKDEICVNFDKAKKLEFKGVVSKKYIDKEEHSYPIILIEQLSGKDLRLNLANDKSDLFQFVQVGDSVFKQKGTTFIIKRQENAESIDIDFGCN